MTSPTPNASWREVFSYFIRLGIFGFGGPLALVGSMQKDLVEKRGWMDPAHFGRAFALIKAMPGPLAFMTAVFLGRSRAGWKGGTAAGIALNLPAFIMMILFGVFYESWRQLPNADNFLLGMQAGALGVVLASLRGLSRAYVREFQFWALAIVAFLITLWFPAYEPILILSSGAITALVFETKLHRTKIKSFFVWPATGLGPFLIGDPTHSTALAQQGFSGAWPDLVWSCFKAGAFVFGSGLAIVPMMESDFVTRLHWLTSREFMDALAFGQITPGPVVITSTFIGFKALGLFGATIATLAIFAASFFHMMTWFPGLVNKLSRLRWINSFLLGAIAAVVGAIAATVLDLSMEWAGQPYAYWLMIFALLTALFSKIPAWSLIPAAGVFSLAFQALGLA